MEDLTTPRPWMQGKLVVTPTVDNMPKGEQERMADREERTIYAKYWVNEHGWSMYRVALCERKADAVYLVEAVSKYDLLRATHDSLLAKMGVVGQMESLQMEIEEYRRTLLMVREENEKLMKVIMEMRSFRKGQ